MAERTFQVPVMFPQDVREDSWLHRPAYKWFLRGLSYARTQTRAIPALAKCSPEELEAAVWAIMRGNGWDPDTLPDRDPYGYEGGGYWANVPSKYPDVR